MKYQYQDDRIIQNTFKGMIKITLMSNREQGTHEIEDIKKNQTKFFNGKNSITKIKK